MPSQIISKIQGSATLSGTLGVATVVHPGLSTSHFDINRRTSFLSPTLALCLWLHQTASKCFISRKASAPVIRNKLPPSSHREPQKPGDD